MTERAFATNVPVFRVDGEKRGELARDLSIVEIEEDTAGLKRMTARFIAQGPKQGETTETQLYLDGDVFDFGKPITISIGPPDEERKLFDGAITGIEVDFAETRPSDVLVYAEDKLMDFRMTRRSRSYQNKSDADIARDLAGDHGLTPDVDADGPTYDVVQQFNQSDLAFLRARAQLIQAEVWVDGSTLYFKSRANRTATAITLVRGNQLIGVRIRADLAHQRTKVKVSGYDATARAIIDEEAGDDAVQAEVSGGRTGPSVLQKAFGDRVSQRVREVPLTDSEARDWAKAEMVRRARGFVIAEGVTDGTPDMVVGSVLTLQGVGAPFEGGSYYVTRVCHSYDLAHGHRTRFTAERATINEAT